jgi:hypothetical protein
MQLFQVLASNFLLTDPDCLLSTMAKEQALSPPSASGGDEYIYVDRDWWLFRYILIFLRDQVLPDNRKLLAQVKHLCSAHPYNVMLIYYRIILMYCHFGVEC